MTRIFQQQQQQQQRQHRLQNIFLSTGGLESVVVVDNEPLANVPTLTTTHNTNIQHIPDIDSSLSGNKQ
jgi:hypothetical protein